MDCFFNVMVMQPSGVVVRALDLQLKKVAGSNLGRFTFM